MNDWLPPSHWEEAEAELWDTFVDIDARLGSDTYAEILFHHAYFDREMSFEVRDQLHDYLADYLADEYDIDFDYEFDWEGYRAWY